MRKLILILMGLVIAGNVFAQTIMQGGVGGSVQQQQVLYSIVCLFLIYVVNNFFIRKVSPNTFFHYKTMFLNIFSISNIRMIRGVNINIPIYTGIRPSFPSVRSLPFKGFSKALERTKGSFRDFGFLPINMFTAYFARKLFSLSWGYRRLANLGFAVALPRTKNTMAFGWGTEHKFLTRLARMITTGFIQTRHPLFRLPITFIGAVTMPVISRFYAVKSFIARFANNVNSIPTRLAKTARGTIDLMTFNSREIFFTNRACLFHKMIVTLIIVLCQVGNCYSADQWDKTVPLSSSSWINFPADQQKNNAAIDRLLANYREGMTLSYVSATTVSVAAGEVTCSNSDGTVRKMRNNPSSTNVTFADIDAGAEAPSTTYYVYASCDADAATATFKVSLSSSTPTGLTYYKKLGSFYNDGSSNIITVTNDNASYFGSWTSKTVGSTYQALTDGFYSVFGGTYACRGQQIYVYSDSSSSPSTLRGQYGSGSDQGSGTAITIPVRQGDYYKATFSSTDGCSATSYFVAAK